MSFGSRCRSSKWMKPLPKCAGGSFRSLSSRLCCRWGSPTSLRARSAAASGELQLFADGLVNARFSETLPPAPDDELGALARSLNSMSSQLRDMLELLKLEASRRDAILAGMVEGVLAVDHELCVTFCNQAFARAVGARYPASERLPVLELVRDPAFLNLLTRTVVTAEPQKQRMQLSAAEGHSFEVQAAPLELRSGRGAIAILHDVTDLERLERVRRDFVANVSHELRTPLAAIQGYAETLLDGALEDSEHNRRFVEVIQAHAVRLNNIASDLLALSELESTDAGPSPERSQCGRPSTPPGTASSPRRASVMSGSIAATCRMST